MDLATSPVVRECLDDLDATIIVDLEDVTFLDLSGKGAFVTARKRLIAWRGSLVAPSSAAARSPGARGHRPGGIDRPAGWAPRRKVSDDLRPYPSVPRRR